MSRPREVLGIRTRPAAEIQHARFHRHDGFHCAMHARTHRGQRAVVRVRSVVAHRHAVERVLCVDEAWRHDAHGALLHDVFSEQTQRTQTGSAPTSNDLRNVRRFRATMDAIGASRTLPMDPWKKHGRTEPFASTTTETQGALQVTSGNGSAPRNAA